MSARLASAQSSVLDPSNLAWQQQNQNRAAIFSDITVGASILADTIQSFRATDKKTAFEKQALRTTIDTGVAELVKILVHRKRPCYTSTCAGDTQSFYSEHTAIASQTNSLRIGISLGIATGYFRIAANKHYLTDTIVGLAAGILTSRFVKYTPVPDFTPTGVTY